MTSTQTLKEKAEEIANNEAKPHTPAVILSCYLSAIKMHEWTMQQVEDKMVQIIICAQQGYTQCAPDDVVKKHCMEILNSDEL